jgi:RNA polymerase II elongation factor ELL
MPSLVIPESGLTLGGFPGSPSKSGSEVPEVLGLALTDGVIEEMIKCVQNGKPIQLSLGEHPVSFQFTLGHNRSGARLDALLFGSQQ